MDILSFVGTLANVTGLHGWVTGLKTGRQLGELTSRMQAMESEVMRISDNILYAPSYRPVTCRRSPASA